MTPLDDQLRQTLSERAALLAPSPDPLAGVEARATRIRRRRATAAVAGAAAVVAAVALAVPGLVPDRDAGPDRVATTPTPSAVSTSEAVLDPAHPWPLWGDETLLTARTKELLQQEWAKGHPGSTLVPLFVQRWEPSGQVELAFVSRGDDLRVGWADVEDGGVRILRDEAVQPEAAYQFALDGDEGVTRLYVVAAPDSRVEYAPDGVTYRDVTQVFMTHKDGVGTSTTTSRGGVGVTAVETAGARVRVRAADGSVVYEAAARGASVSSTPANVLDWPSRGDASAGPSVAELEVAFSRANGRPDQSAVDYRPLFTADTDSGVRFTVGQAWFEGETRATTVSYATGGTKGPLLEQYGFTLDATAAVLALLRDLPGTSVDLLVVIPVPTTGQVSYAAAATGAFLPVTGQDHLDGVVLIDRAKDATEDRLEILNGNGDPAHPNYRGPVATLLAGSPVH